MGFGVLVAILRFQCLTVAENGRTEKRIRRSLQFHQIHGKGVRGNVSPHTRFGHLGCQVPEPGHGFLRGLRRGATA
ncbi:MAG: hypothetical protein EBU36_03915 [Verrucomicrobia bacterium]|nr:hypothetical protein [Verrucomicrobiota bacterium]